MTFESSTLEGGVYIFIYNSGGFMKISRFDDLAFSKNKTGRKAQRRAPIGTSAYPVSSVQHGSHSGKKSDPSAATNKKHDANFFEWFRSDCIITETIHLEKK